MAQTNAQPVGAQSWPADRVERRSVAELVPAARNARKHSTDQIKKIARSITEFGWTQPVILDEAGGILAGHGRILAAKLLKLETVPCAIAADWTSEQKVAYGVTDNQLALLSTWDDDNLRATMGELKGLGFDLSSTGFESKALAAIMSPGGLAAPNVAAQLQDVRFQIIVECADEQDQAAMLGRFEQQGMKCRPLML